MKILYSINSDSFELNDPSTERLIELLHKVNNTDFPYLILEAADGSYIQTAGEANKMIVEARFYHNADFKHYVIEKAKDSQLPAVLSEEPGASTPPVRTDVLTLTDCETLFISFLNSTNIDKSYYAKNITSNYL